MFVLKKIIGAAIMPFSVGALMLLLGLVLLWFTRRQVLGRVIVTAGTVFLLVVGCAPLSNELVRTLEAPYPPLTDTRSVQDVRWVVVLGSGHVSDPGRPPTLKLTGQALARLTEGIRLHRSLPGSRLILSGGALWDSVPHATVLAEAAAAMGVSPHAIVAEPRPRDTDDEARLISERVGSDPFILVTSASHMPRALALFRAHGARPIPAPTDYAHQPDFVVRPESFLPTAGGLRNSERAVKEYVGRLYTWLITR